MRESGLNPGPQREKFPSLVYAPPPPMSFQERAFEPNIFANDPEWQVRMAEAKKGIVDLKRKRRRRADDEGDIDDVFSEVVELSLE